MIVAGGRVALAAALLTALLATGPAAAQGGPPVMRHDGDGDGRVTRKEFPGPDHVFKRLDRDGDGAVTRGDFRRGRQGGSGPTSRGRAGAAPPDTVSATPIEFPGVDVHLHLHFMDLGQAMGQGQGGDRRGRGRGGPPTAAGIVTGLARAADALVAMMDRRGLATALVVTVPFHGLSAEENFRAVSEAVRRHPDRLRHLAGGARLKAMLAEIPAERVTRADRDRFRRLAKEVLDGGAVGFGEMISYHLCMTERHNFQYVPPDHPLFMVLADVAAERDVAIDLHMEAIVRKGPMPSNLARRCTKNPAELRPTIAGFERLLAHNRGARIVWQHIGWDNTGQMTLDLLGRLLTRHDNLFLALRVPRHRPSGHIPPNRITDASYRINADWLAFMERFQDRLVIGSDEFVSPSGGNDLAASFDETWSIIGQLSPAVARKIGGDNARRIYGLH
jgi:hypothetical protein